MYRRQALRDPLNRFYLAAMLAPVCVAVGILGFDGAPFAAGDAPDLGKLTIFLRMLFMLLWLILTIVPVMLVVVGIGLPLVGAMVAKETRDGRPRLQRGYPLWPVYCTATIETLLLLVAFSALV